MTEGVAALAIDLGGTRIKAGIVVGRQVVARRVAPTGGEDGAEAIMRRLFALSEDLLAERPARAIGICLPGVVDEERGSLADVRKNLLSLIDYPMVDAFQRHFSLPTAVENDARLYGLGELTAGAARGAENMVCLTLGTGVGCCVAIDGHILRGKRGTGGILGGHMTLDLNGPSCTCGNIGCVEAFCKAGRLVDLWRQAQAAGEDERQGSSGAPVTPEVVLAAAARGDPAATQAQAEYARGLAAAVVSYIHLYDADIVVLGGGLMRVGQTMLPAVRRYVAEHTWTCPPRQVPVEAAALGDDAALVGAASLARGFAAFR
jgi:glucokinase